MSKNKLHLLIIDNYDSFSYNLVEHLRAFDQVEYKLVKNDDQALFSDEYDGVIISPGPGLPHESSFLLKAIDFYLGRIPIFGVCLGLQAIVEHYGGKLKQLDTVFHGIKDDLIHFNNSPIFKGIDVHFKAGRYHSWVADKDTLPSLLELAAEDSEGTIMAVQQENDHCYAVQFHPESFMTDEGYIIFENFIALVQNFQEEKLKEITEFSN